MLKTFHKVAVTALAISFLLAPLQAAASDVTVDPKLPAYKKVDGISGKLGSVGSDTMNNLLKYWGESFRKYYPGVTIEVEGKGSSTAPPALIEGTAQLGPMSRKMKSKEVEAFEEKFGYKPTEISTALDALAVFVHKDNPIDSLSLAQIDGIFSKTRKRGVAEDIVTWGTVGLSGKWSGRPISLYGRNSASGTYGYFKERALEGGDYKDQVKEQPGSASVVQGIAEDLNGIGYSGIGYLTSEVKTVHLYDERYQKLAYETSFENVVSGDYPLARFLFLYIAKSPNQPVGPLVREFIKFALSKEGQEIVIKAGYLPIPAQIAEKMLENLG